MVEHCRGGYYEENEPFLGTLRGINGEKKLRSKKTHGIEIEK